MHTDQAEHLCEQRQGPQVMHQVRVGPDLEPHPPPPIQLVRLCVLVLLYHVCPPMSNIVLRILQDRLRCCTLNGMNTKRPGTKSMAFRLPIDLAQRLEAAAALLATDPSHLLRMMIAEHLPEYEERA